MIPAHCCSLPKDIEPTLAEQVPTERFSCFGGIPLTFSGQPLAPTAREKQRQSYRAQKLCLIYTTLRRQYKPVLRKRKE